jgi:hypothetical protein
MSGEATAADADDAREPLLDGRAWREFCDCLREAGDAVLRPEAPASAEDRAEGYRYLLGFLSSTLTRFLQDAGPEHPAFVRIMDDVVKFGLDAPDGTNGFIATLRDDLTYRIWGTAGTVHYVGWQLMAPGRGTVANISLHDFEIGDNGSFEIWLSREPRPGNWVELPKGTNTIGMRQFHYDWEHEELAEVHIEAVNTTPGLPLCLIQRPEAAAFAHALANLGQQFAASAHFWIDFVHGFRAGGDNMAPPAIVNPTIGGNMLQSASNGYFSLAEDEALIAEFTPPAGHYWSVCLGNFWFETLELSHSQTSLNGFQARIDDDGRCRIVVAHADPGYANWLDTVDHREGTITFRWLLCDGTPEITTSVVPFDALAQHLPLGSEQVTIAERAKAIEVRRDNVARRMAMPGTTRWAYSRDPRVGWPS